MKLRTPVAPLALAVMWTLVACDYPRFGNHESDPGNPDAISGNYATEAQSLVFCVNRSTGTSPPCATAPVRQVPSFLSAILTQPVAMAFDGKQTGVLYPPGSSSPPSLQIQVDAPNQAIAMTGTSDRVTFFRDAACTTQLSLQLNGNWTSGGAPSQTDAAGKSWPIRGKLVLEVTVLRSFMGNCSGDLQAALACYQDSAQCGAGDAASNASLQKQFQDLFAPYVAGGGMSEADIPFAADLGYQVSYR